MYPFCERVRKRSLKITQLCCFTSQWAKTKPKGNKEFKNYIAVERKFTQT